MKVIVIGAGPAGLAAAHAATGQKADVTILAPARMTPQEGPLLLQRPIPGINTDHPDGTIHQVVIGGSILQYRYKLYGDINVGINGDILRQHYHAWRHRETYERLWQLYSGLITDYVLTPREMRNIHREADLVVSTASAQTMCTVGHHFLYKEVGVTPEFSYPDQPDNTIIFNAAPAPAWVRSSRVFGVPVTEWAVGSQHGMPTNARIIRKPISTDCDCYTNILRTGRFGAWKNEVWIDTAYWDTYSAIESINSAHIRDIGDLYPNQVNISIPKDMGDEFDRQPEPVPDLHGNQQQGLYRTYRARHHISAR
jgi:hypothetical protein